MKSRTIFLFLLFFTTLSYAQVISQWRGAERDGKYLNERNLLKQWPEDGPELLWVHDSLPTGHSSVCIGKDKLYLTGLVDTLDYLIALDKKGNEIWRNPIGTGWTESFSDSRSTPTLVDNRIFVQSGKGFVAAFNAETGEELWKRDAFTEFNGKTGTWGFSESLLYVDEKVLVSVGGHETNTIAFDANSGEVVWKSETINDTTAYVSPVLVEKNGLKVAVNLMSNNVFGVNVKNGEILFAHNYSEIDDEDAYALWNSPGASRINTNTPVFYDGCIYVTSGYNHVGAKFKLSDDFRKCELLWTDSILDVHFGHVILHEGYIYGSNWYNNANGDWCCIDWETGEPRYVEKWHTKGNIIFADGLLYIYEEKRGHIGIVVPNPEKFEVISSFKVPYGRGPHWAHPVIHDGILYIRHGKALMAYDVRAE
jgi:outer membrane protein assembly factor BamB